MENFTLKKSLLQSLQGFPTRDALPSLIKSRNLPYMYHFMFT